MARKAHVKLQASWEMLPDMMRFIGPQELSQMTISHLHKGHQIQAALLVQDMFKAQEIAQLEEEALRKMEGLILKLEAEGEATLKEGPGVEGQ